METPTRGSPKREYAGPRGQPGTVLPRIPVAPPPPSSSLSSALAFSGFSEFRRHQVLHIYMYMCIYVYVCVCHTRSEEQPRDIQDSGPLNFSAIASFGTIYPFIPACLLPSSVPLQEETKGQDRGCRISRMYEA